MNREIKFRGKGIADNEWYYGDLIQVESGRVHYFIIQDYEIKEERIELNTCASPEVIPETIGQYTGLNDKNGKEIYEGDIVTGSDYPFIDEDKQNYVGIVVFYDDVAQFGYEYKCIRKDKRGISNGINNEFEANENLVCEDLEVIGNIYDNPELLEGE